MADVEAARLENGALPLLPLAAGVVLPQTVVTLALETEEAKAAAATALDGDGRVLLVPRIDGGYARVGTVARVEDSGELPNGIGAVILRGLHRAVLGAGVAGTGPGLWVQADPVEDGEPSERARELGRELRSVLTVLAERRNSRRLPELLRSVDDPGALADGFGAWSDMVPERKVELLETVDVEARLDKVLAWAREALAEHEVTERIRSRGHRRHGEDPARVPAAPAARRHPQGAGRGRRRRLIEGYRAAHRRGEAARGGARSRRARGRPARAHRRAEPRARVDPHLARHAARAAVGRGAATTGST